MVSDANHAPPPPHLGERPAPGKPFWVFGYGSLMWRPGFDYETAYDAVLHGYSRSFCIYSFHHRGTRASPGLVLGLDAGGECLGRIFRVRGEDAERVTAYLEERELVNYPYIARFLPVEARGADAPRSVVAWTFVADPDHPDYAGGLPVEKAASLIMRASGIAGLNRDYLMQTVRHLETAGFVDEHLHALLREIETQTGVIDMGSGI